MLKCLCPHHIIYLMNPRMNNIDFNLDFLLSYVTLLFLKMTKKYFKEETTLKKNILKISLS